MSSHKKLALNETKVEVPIAIVCEIQIDEIDADDETFQYRFNPRTNGLKASLESEGQRMPIDIKGQKKPYVIVDGFRRVLAARELGWQRIKATVHKDLSAKSAFLLAFTQNVCRQNLTPMEKAHAIFLAKKRGLKKNKIAEMFGLSERMIERYQNLTSLPQAIQRIMDWKKVTILHAKLLFDARVTDPEAWANRIDEENLSASKLKRLLRKRLNNGTPKKKVYFTKEKNILHFSAFRIRCDAGNDEKALILIALKEALEELERYCD